MYGFTIRIDPVPASRPRVARYGTYYAPKYTQYRKDLARELSKVKGNKLIYDNPLVIDVTFVIPLPKSYSKKKSAELVGEYCISNMDLDNLEKALYDAMNGVIFADDKQIVQHTVKKVWGRDGGIGIFFSIAGHGRKEIKI